MPTRAVLSGWQGLVFLLPAILATPPSPCDSFFAPYVSIRQQTYVSIRPHTAAYVSIRQYNESPGLARKHFPLLCQHLYFCTFEANKLKFNVFFVNPNA